ncbi:putative fluoride ion transporter CrcB [compost metagenome]
MGVGVLGGFTTFSTFTVDADRLADGGDPWLALASIAITVVLGIAAAAAAMAASRARTLRHDRP